MNGFRIRRGFPQGGDHEIETQVRVGLSKQKHARKGFPGKSKYKGGGRTCLRNRPVQLPGNEQGVGVDVGGVCVCVSVCERETDRACGGVEGGI